MNLIELTSAKLRSLASIKEQIETLEAQTSAILEGKEPAPIPVPGGSRVVHEPKSKNGRRAVREARMKQVRRWKRQGRDGRGQLI